MSWLLYGMFLSLWLCEFGKFSYSSAWPFNMSLLVMGVVSVGYGGELFAIHKLCGVRHNLIVFSQHCPRTYTPCLCQEVLAVFDAWFSPDNTFNLLSPTSFFLHNSTLLLCNSILSNRQTHCFQFIITKCKNLSFQ